MVVKNLIRELTVKGSSGLVPDHSLAVEKFNPVGEFLSRYLADSNPVH